MLRFADVSRLGDGRVLYLRGTPYEQGRQLGQGAGDLIRENIRASAQLCEAVASDLNVEAYRTMTRRNEAWVSRQYPSCSTSCTALPKGRGSSTPSCST